jgi:hypothetical protein
MLSANSGPVGPCVRLGRPHEPAFAVPRSFHIAHSVIVRQSRLATFARSETALEEW